MVLLCILQYCTSVQCVVLYFGKSVWPLAKLCAWGEGVKPLCEKSIHIH